MYKYGKIIANANALSRNPIAQAVLRLSI